MSIGDHVNAAAITVGTSATLLVTARMNRDSVLVQNKDAAVISVGPSTVTMAGATAGIEIAAGGQQNFETFNGALYGISTAGTAANAVRVFEVY